MIEFPPSFDPTEMMNSILKPAAIVVLFACPMFVHAAEPKAEERPVPAASEKSVDFVSDIKPILDTHCVDCHGEFVQEGYLRLDARNLVRRGGLSGPLYEVGKSGESYLVARLLGHGDETQMPLDADPLTDEQIGLIRAWIDQGAKWPDGVGPENAELDVHWAYIKPERPALPEVSRPEWVKNPIDAFVLKKLDEVGLSPSPEAEKTKLLRRVYLDLIGLPPTVEEQDRFLADTSPEAYENVVDELLASKHFGERWARHWLDMARYADSNGFQADQYREVWPYRDWVINAFNKDMPFDQFTVEQLAGDLLPNATPEQKIATGFHRQTTCNVEAGVDPEENRVNQVIDRVNTTGTVWLGTTMECVQCHNHKYDPFVMEDYYGLFAYFNNTLIEVKHATGTTYEFYGPKMDLELTEAQQQQKRNLNQQLAALETKQQQRQREVLKGFSTWLAESTKQVEAQASADVPAWDTLDVVEFQSANGSQHRRLEDGSILLEGDGPATDVYTVKVKTNSAKIGAIRIETMTDDSLPGKGPGRHSETNPNFVLNEFSVSRIEADEATELKLTKAIADYEQAQYQVAKAIDGDPAPKSGWAIHSEFHKPHWAAFALAEPFATEDETTLIVKLEQHHGERRTIGRFRLSVAAALITEETESEHPAEIVKLLVKADERTKQEDAKLRRHFLARDEQLTKLNKQVSAKKKQIENVKPHTTLVMIEQEQPRETRLLKRGEFLNPGPTVIARTPRMLHEKREGLPDNRLGLAKWIVDRENPLTARVTVNRWWALIYGQGLVTTLEDFGTQSDPPTHPELLDWLAVEFMDSGWSMKHMIRLMVTSNTYKQSSRVTEELLREDASNRWLARGPRYRLPAEMIRDNALRITSLLSTKSGGPPVFPPQPNGIWRHVGRNAPKYNVAEDENRFRRGIYVIWRRSAPYASFVNFDAPDRASCVVNRPRTNTPLQALTLLNDEAYTEMAWELALKLLRDESLTSDAERIEYAFRACVARTPVTDEFEFLRTFLEDRQTELAGNTGELNRATKGRELPEGVDPANAVAWFHVANLLLNLDETITKN